MSDFFCFYLMLSDTIELKLRRIVKMKQLKSQEKQSAPWWNKPFQGRATPIPSPAFRRVRGNGKISFQRIGPVSAPSREALPEGDNWQVDEHWVAVTSYLAEMDFPNEG